MKYIQTFGKDQIGFKDRVVNLGKRLIESWSGYSLLLESVQEAKAIVDQLIREKMDELPDASQEEKDAIANRLRNQFETIKRAFQANPGYMPAMVRFHFLHGIKIEKLNQLLELIAQNKDSLDELSMTIDEYSRLKPVADKSGILPYEKLTDEFNKIAELREGNWIVKALPRNAMSRLIELGLHKGSPVDLKEEYRNATPEVKTQLRLAAARLTRLNKPGFIQSVRKSVGGKDSIEAVISLLNKTYDGATSDIGELVETAYSAYPSVAVLYFDGNRAVFSFRNDSQLPTLCSGAVSWCIQPAWYNPGYADNFWNYATGSVQLGILDFSVPADSRYRTTGVTIEPGGRVRSLCDQTNSCTSGSDYKTTLSNFKTGDSFHSYPEDLIAAIQEAFDSEVRVKKITDPIYKKLKEPTAGQRNRTQAAISTVENLVKNIGDFQRMANTPSEQKDRDLANLVIASEIQSLSNTPQAKQIREHFVKSYGSGVLVSPTSVDVIETVLGGSEQLTTDFLDSLINRTSKALKMLTDNISQAEKIHGAKLGSTIDFLRQRRDVIQDAVASAEKLKQKITSAS